MVCPAQQIHRKSPRNKTQAKRTEKFDNKKQERSRSSSLSIFNEQNYREFFLKVEKIMKFARFSLGEFSCFENL
jgi:hypothetical protein